MAKISTLRLGDTDQLKLDVVRGAVAGFEVAGTDLVLRMADGGSIVVQDFALQAMLNPVKLVFADGSTATGAELLAKVSNIGATEKSVQVATPKLIVPGGAGVGDTPRNSDRSKAEREVGGESRNEDRNSGVVEAAQTLTSTAPKVANLQQVINAPVPATVTPIQPPSDARTQAAPTAKVADTAERSLFIPPSAPTINVVAGNDQINLKEANLSTGVVVSGAGVSNALVTLTIKGATATVTKAAAVINGTWTLPLMAADLSGLGQGALEFSAVQSYIGGAPSPSSKRDVMLDTISPNAPTFDKVAGVDLVNADALNRSIGVSGSSAEQDGSIAVKLTGPKGAITKETAVSGGRWVVTLEKADIEALGQGQIKVSAVVSDAAGNTSPEGAHAFLVDTVPPEAPTMDAPAGDGIINLVERSSGVTLTGTAEAGAKVRVVMLGSLGQVALEAVADASGRWQAALPTTEVDALGQGVVATTLQAVDQAGNLSKAVATVFTVDTLAPLAPTVEKIATDNAVNAEESNAAVAIQGQAEVGSVVRVQLSAAGGAQVNLTSDPVGPDGNWVLQLGPQDIKALGDGLLSVEATATDVAGNVSAPARQDLTVDTVPPPVPSVDPIAVDAYMNGVEILQGLQISGSAAQASQVRITVQGGAASVEHTVAVDPQGQGWQLRLSETELRAVGEGRVSIEVRAEDAVGNQSPVVTAQPFVIDTIAPSSPGVDAIGGDDLVNMAEAAGGVTLSGKSWAGEGRTEQGGTVRLELIKYKAPELGADGSASAQAEPVIESITSLVADVGADGRWTTSLSAALAQLGDGKMAIKAVAEDAAGNRSAPTLHSFIYDTTPPLAPEVNMVSLDDLVGKPEALRGFAISGTAEAAATVAVKIVGGGVDYVAKVVAGPLGTWSLSLPAEVSKLMTSGSYQVTATATDVVGNVSAAGSHSFLVDIDPPLAPVLSLIAGDDIVNLTELQSEVQFAGTAEANATIKLTLSKGATGTDPAVVTEALEALQTLEVIADGSGNWSISANLNSLGTGQVIAAATQTDAAGNVSVAGTRAFVIDTTPPLPIDPPNANDGWLSKAEYDTPSFVLSGTTEPDAKVSVKLSGQSGALAPIEVRADAAGRWSLAALTQSQVDALGQGTVSVELTQTDKAGNAGGAPTLSEFKIDTVAPTAAPTMNAVSGDNLIGFADWPNPLSNVPLSGTADAGNKVLLTINNERTGKSINLETLADASGNWQLDFNQARVQADLGDAQGPAGIYRVALRQADAAGNISPTGSSAFEVDLSVTDVRLETVAGRAPLETGEFTIGQADANGDVLLSGKVEIGSQGLTVKVSSSLSSVQKVLLASDIDPSTGEFRINPSTGEFRIILTAAELAELDTWFDPQSGPTGAGAPRHLDQTLTARMQVTDSGGNQTSQDYTIYLDRQAPTAPTLNALADNSINVADRAGNVMTLTGTGEPNSLIKLRFWKADDSEVDFGVDVPVGRVDSSSAWSLKLTVAQLDKIGQGAVQVAAYATDLALNNSASTAPRSFSIDTVAPTLTLPDADNTELKDGYVSLAELQSDAALKLSVNNGGETGATTLTYTITSTTDATKQLSYTSAASSSGTHALSIASSDLLTKFGNDQALKLSVTAVDGAGNTTAAAFTKDFVLDATPPTIALGNPANGWFNKAQYDAMVSAGKHIVSGTSEAGATLNLTLSNTIYPAGVKFTDVVADADGKWQLELSKSDFDKLYPPGSSGHVTVNVTGDATDAAGNPSAAFSTSFKIDTDLPDAPTVDGGAVFINADAAQNGVTLTGTASADSTVKVSFVTGDPQVETVVKTGVLVNAGGVWTATLLAAELTGYSGTGQVRLYAVDAAGNNSLGFGSVPLEVDTQAPTLTLNAVKGDDVVNIAERDDANGLTLTGSYDESLSAAGMGLVITGANAVLGSLVTPKAATLTPGAAGGTWSLALTQAELASLGHGAVEVRLVATDLAGNKADTKLGFRNDYVAPAAPVLTGTVDDLQINRDEANAGVTINGTAEAGARLNFKLNGNAVTGLNDQTAAADGTWSITLNKAMLDDLVADGSEGRATLTVTPTDTAGNPGTALTESQLLVIDRKAPAAPTDLLNVAGQEWLNIAERSTDGITISGKAEAGAFGDSKATVTLINPAKVTASGTLVLDAATVASDGTWTATVSKSELDGLFNLAGLPTKLTASVTVADLAGNVSSASTADITLDQVRPVVSTILRLIDGVAESGTGALIINRADAGLLAEADNKTVTIQIELNEAASGAVLWLKDVTASPTAPNQSYVAVAATDPDGGKRWQATVSAADLAALGNGSAKLEVVATDLAGNANTTVYKRDLTVDLTAPAAPTMTLPTEWTDGIVGDDLAKAITGTAEANATVKVTVVSDKGGEQTYTATADGTGAWSVTVPQSDFDPVSGVLKQNLPTGGANLSITATATDAAGNVSPASAAQTREVDTIGPVAPVVDESVAVPGLYNLANTSGASPVEWKGTAEAGVKVKVQYGTVGQPGYFTKTVTAGSDGNWTIQPTATEWDVVGTGNYTGNLRFSTVDSVGNESPTQVTFNNVKVDRAGPVVNIADVTADNVVGGTELAGVVLSGTTALLDMNASTFKLKLDDGDATTATVELTPVYNTINGTWTAAFSQANQPQLQGLKEGTITISSVATDTSGNAKLESAGQKTFVLDKTGPSLSQSSLNISVTDTLLNKTERDATADLVISGTLNGETNATYKPQLLKLTLRDTAKTGVNGDLPHEVELTVAAADMTHNGNKWIWTANLDKATRQTLNDGDIVVAKVEATDYAGNTSTATPDGTTWANKLFTLDTVAPSLTGTDDKLTGISATDLFLNLAERGANWGFVSGNGPTLSELGTIDVVMTATGSSTRTATVNVTNANPNGTAGYYATLTNLFSSTLLQTFHTKTDVKMVLTPKDAAGNAGTAVEFTNMKFDFTPPLIPTITAGTGFKATTGGADQSTYLNKTGVTDGLTIGGVAEKGATVTVTLFKSVTSVTEATIGEAPATTMVSTSITTTAKVDAVAAAPGIPAVAYSPATIITTKTTITAGPSSTTTIETTTDYAWTTTVPSPTGAGTTATWSLETGTLTGLVTEAATTNFKVKATDAAGNPSPVLTESTTVDTVNDLSGLSYSGLSGADAYINLAEANTGLTASASTAESGASVVASLIKGASSVARAAQTLSGATYTQSSAFTKANLDTLGEGEITYRLVSTDAAGNVTTVDKTFTYDKTAPTHNSFGTVAGDGYINKAESDNVLGVALSGFASEKLGSVTLSVTSTGSAVTKAPTVTLNSDGLGWTASLTPADLDALLDGTLTLKVNATDLAGNAMAQATQTFILDTDAPVAGTLTSAGGDAKLSANNLAADTFVLSGATGASKLIVGNITRGTNTQSINDLTVTAGAATLTLTNAQATALGDGAATFTYRTQDAAGNNSSDVTVNFTIDSTAPVQSTDTVSSPLYLLDNAERALTTSQLGATDVHTVTWTVKSVPTDFKIFNGSTELATNSTFTAADVSAGSIKVKFVGTTGSTALQTFKFRANDDYANTAVADLDIKVHGTLQSTLTNGGLTLDSNQLANGVLQVVSSTNGSLTGRDLESGAKPDILYGSSGNNTLIGGAGNDVLYSLAGNDALDGGAGDDTLVVQAGAKSTVAGGTGTDTLVYAMGTTAVTVDLTAGSGSAGAGNTLTTVSGIENVTAAGGSDTLTGDANANVLDGGDGNDTLTGKGGNDTLKGGAGTDTYQAGNGGATVDLATGAASADGDGGNDTLTGIENITGGSGIDTLTGDGNANVLKGGAGNDALNGKAGNDTLEGEAGVDTLNGEDGDDILSGGSGNDTLNGGTGTDTYLVGNSGATVSLANGTASADGDGGSDTLSNIENVTGGNGNDSLTGDGNTNVLSGGDGNDTLRGGAGSDTLNGGAGTDTYKTGDLGATVSLAGAISSDGDGGVDTISNFENITGGSGTDNLTGDGNANVLSGGAEDDTLIGAAGADTLNGDAGDDSLSGGADNDTLNGGADSDSLSGGLGNDTLDGGLGSDTYVTGNNGAVVNLSTAVAGVVTVTSTGETSGTDTLRNIENITGGDGNDVLTGDANANVLSGGAGADTLDGGDGADVFYSSQLLSTLAIDTFRLGTGSNTMNFELTTGFGTGNLTGYSFNAFGYLGSTPANVTTTSGTTVVATIIASKAATGTAEVNTFNFTSFQDTVITASFNDVFNLGAGDDKAGIGKNVGTPSGRVDTVDGGSGTDTLEFAGGTILSGSTFDIDTGAGSMINTLGASKGFTATNFEKIDWSTSNPGGGEDAISVIWATLKDKVTSINAGGNINTGFSNDADVLSIRGFENSADSSDRLDLSSILTNKVDGIEFLKLDSDSSGVTNFKLDSAAIFAMTDSTETSFKIALEAGDTLEIGGTTYNAGSVDLILTGAGSRPNITVDFSSWTGS